MKVRVVGKSQEGRVDGKGTRCEDEQKSDEHRSVPAAAGGRDKPPQSWDLWTDPRSDKPVGRKGWRRAKNWSL